MSKLLKKLIFHDKILLNENNFCLDIYPQQGFKGLFMNNCKEINRFIKSNQIQNYYLINLCSQQLKDCKDFEGHNDQFKIDEFCPPNSLYSFYNSIEQWIRDNNNSIKYFFIYSKHGRSRAAMVACCIQIRLQPNISLLNIDDIIYKCCTKIVKNDSQFLMKEGQLRYIKYYYQLLLNVQWYGNSNYMFPTRLLLKIQVNQPAQQLTLKLNTQNKDIQCQPQTNGQDIYEYEINQYITGDFIIQGKLKRKFTLPLNTIDDQTFFEQEEIDWQDQKIYPCFWIRLFYELTQ